MIRRAYSQLTIKAVDGPGRTITGWATTPSADRTGDVVEPSGAVFALPIPLLMGHDTAAPIGHVTRAAVSDRGIEITATIAAIDEPGVLRDRLDSAWQSIKIGLVRGLSIGFQSLEHSLLEGGGYRFVKWSWLELSAVVIPANADASIATIKSLDSESVPAGVTAVVNTPRGCTAMPTTIAEQINSYNASRTAKAAAMSALMDAAGAAGTTLDAGQSEQYDTLAAEIAEVDKHLGRLDTQQRMATMKAITPLAPAVAPGAGAAPIVRQVSVTPNLPPGIEYARAIICKAKSLFVGGSVSPVEFAKGLYPDHPRIQTFLKGTVAAASTGDPAWAGVLAEPTNLASEFIEFLRPDTILGKFGVGGIPSLRRVPFNVRITGQTSGGAGYWVAEGNAKPLTKFAYAPQTLLWSKVAAISVITEESIRFSTPSIEALVRDGLRDALAERLDIDFIDPAKALVVGTSPASITNGLTPLTSSGNTADNVRQDVAAILGAYATTNQKVGGLVLIAPTSLTLGLSMMRTALGQPEFPDVSMNGGSLMGIPVITSEYANMGLPSGALLIALNTRDVLLADDGSVSVEASREASLQMTDDPTNNSITANGQSLVSMFQTNSVALKAERFINWAVARPGAVVYMDGVAWGTV